MIITLLTYSKFLFSSIFHRHGRAIIPPVLTLPLKILGLLTSMDNRLQNKSNCGQRGQTYFHIISKEQHDVNEVASEDKTLEFISNI